LTHLPGVYLRRLVSTPGRQNSLGSLLIQGTQRLSRILVIIVAAAVLDAAAFASLAVSLALSDLLRGALQGFDVGLVRQLTAGQDPDAVVKTNLDAKLLLGGAGLMATMLLALAAYGMTPFAVTSVACVGAIAGSMGATFLARSQAGLALHRSSPEVVAAGAIGVLGALAGLAMGAGALGVATGLAVGDTTLLVLVARGHRWSRPGRAAAFALVRASRRLIVMQLAYIGQFRVGTIVLGLVGSAVAVAEYTVASRIAEGMVVLAAALSATSLPLLGSAVAARDRTRLLAVVDRSYRLAIQSITLVMSVVVLAAPILIAVVFPRYPDAGATLAVVGLSIVVFFGSSQTTALLNAAHEDRAASVSAVSGLGVTLVVSIALAPLGSIGVAWARVAGEGTRLLIECGASVRRLAVPASLLVRPWLLALPVLVGMAATVLAGWHIPALLLGVAAVLIAAMELAVPLWTPRREGP
jgi:O-antigen/teichoic acid export membrane protein